MSEADELFDALVEFISTKSNVVVITGAGCSTESGIGDYRDEQGNWKRPQPVLHNDFMRSLYWRQRYWARSLLGFPEFMRAEPNRCHAGLAQLERNGHLKLLVTQNVDRLHQRAGHMNVVDLHGRLDRVVCTACGDVSDRMELQSWLERHNVDVGVLDYQAAPDGDADVELERFEDVVVPDCFRCGGILKPDVVFYGDSVPRQVVDVVYRSIASADGLLVVGSSLMVYSGFRFVRRAHELGLPIAAINQGRTRADDLLSIKCTRDCGEIMAKLTREICEA